jgi:hypothetical protein
MDAFAFRTMWISCALLSGGQAARLQRERASPEEEPDRLLGLQLSRQRDSCSGACVRAFLAAFEQAATMPAGGPSALPTGVAAVMVTSTVSAVGSDLSDFCVVAARDCFGTGVERGHAIVALTRATGANGVAVDPSNRLEEQPDEAYEDA